MTKLEEMLPEMYRQMHRDGAFKGNTWEAHRHSLQQFLAFRPSGRILDFGCGPTGGLAKYYGYERVISHDPFVPEYAADPWSEQFSIFFSCDVFEHLTQEQLLQLTRRLCKHTSINLVFVALSTRPANKLLPNGLNAHLTIRAPQWWEGFFAATLCPHFVPEVMRTDLIHDEAVFAFARKGFEREALRGE